MVKKRELHWMLSRSMASVEVTEFHAADAYSNKSNRFKVQN
jgi:hypothetical protein